MTLLNAIKQCVNDHDNQLFDEDYASHAFGVYWGLFHWV